MKNDQLLLIAIAGSVIATIGFFIRPEGYATIKYVVSALAILIILAFYFLSFSQMRHKKTSILL